MIGCVSLLIFIFVKKKFKILGSVRVLKFNSKIFVVLCSFFDFFIEMIFERVFMFILFM